MHKDFLSNLTFASLQASNANCLISYICCILSISVTVNVAVMVFSRMIYFFEFMIFLVTDLQIDNRVVPVHGSNRQVSASAFEKTQKQSIRARNKGAQ